VALGVAPVDQETCVELVVAHAVLLAPPSPAAHAEAKVALEAGAPSYLRRAIGDIAAAAGDPVALAAPERVESDDAVQQWLDAACAPGAGTGTRLDRTTCLDLSLARTELAAPTSPEALALARATFSAKAPPYLQPSVDALLAAATDPTKVGDRAASAADEGVRYWMNIACAPAPTTTVTTAVAPGR
jgi:hypothetical protein